MDSNITTLGNTENSHETTPNPTVKLDRRFIFSSNEKHNLWELFSNSLLLFKPYPSVDDIEEEVKSIHEIIGVFEEWKSQISAKKMSLSDFCKSIEKFTFHAETQDYRLRAIHKYKLLKKNMNFNSSNKKPEPAKSEDGAHNDLPDDQVSDLKFSENYRGLEGDHGIREMLNAKRELALKKRKLLLINRE